MWIKKTCQMCGSEYRIGNGKSKYCCDECRRKAHKIKQKEWRENHPNYQKEWTSTHPNYQRDWWNARRDQKSPM